MVLTAGSLAGTPASNSASPARQVGPIPWSEIPPAPGYTGTAPPLPYRALSQSVPFLTAASISLGVAAGAVAHASKTAAARPAARMDADIGKPSRRTDVGRWENCSTNDGPPTARGRAIPLSPSKQ